MLLAWYRHRFPGGLPHLRATGSMPFDAVQLKFRLMVNLPQQAAGGRCLLGDCVCAIANSTIPTTSYHNSRWISVSPDSQPPSNVALTHRSTLWSTIFVLHLYDIKKICYLGQSPPGCYLTLTLPLITPWGDPLLLGPFS